MKDFVLSKPKRNGFVWFLALPQKDKAKLFKSTSDKICSHLAQGYSLSLSKAMTRKETGLSYNLIDHIARSSMKVLNLQGQSKQENISKRD